MTNYIEPISGFQTTSLTLFDLYERYKSGQIQPYSVWLQRLKQESKWSAKDWFKARSYLFRLISSGETSKSIFTVVDIKLLIARLEEQISTLSPENVKGNIFKKMIQDLENMQQGGCKFILLDGQNRLEYPIKRFFENDLQFYLTNQITKKNKSIGFVLDGKRYSKESFHYKDLSSDEKSLIENIHVIFAVGREGEIDEFIEDLIDDNSGESWNDFERAVTSLRTINYLVNTSLSKGEGNEPAFTQVLKRVGKLSGDYHLEKKGFHKIICELIQYDLNGHLKLDYSTILDETKSELANLKAETSTFGESLSDASSNLDESVVLISDSVGNIEEGSSQLNALLFRVVASIAIILSTIPVPYAPPSLPILLESIYNLCVLGLKLYWIGGKNKNSSVARYSLIAT